MRKILLASLVILAIGAILYGGLLNIPQTAALSPVMERQPNFDASFGSIRSTANVNSLQKFIDSVSTGDRTTVTGIYIPGVLALPVNQQPTGQAGFVTRDPDEATQFTLARQYGTVGILAHNDLAGAQFSDVALGEVAAIVYGDGHVDYYMIDEIQKYQALTPTSTFSDFVNLDKPEERLSAGDLFNRVYAPGGRLVLQTCIANYGDPSWGRIFLIAEPANRQVKTVFDQTVHMLQFASFGLAGY